MSIPDIRIGPTTLGIGKPPLIIAEMSGNHNQSLERALELVEVAARAGAHALKLQTYTADTMTIDIAEGEFFIADPDSPWSGNSLYQLYEQAHTPWDWHKPIFDRCRQLGMIGFSTPFDATAVDFLQELEVPLFKIASFENIDHALIAKVAATGKPIIMSTGLASVGELEESVRVAREAGARDLVLLKCTSSYPAPVEASNLRTIPHMRELFGAHVGLSDHSLGIGAAVAATALGAVAIEKHFTTSRAHGGVDSHFSLEPHELAALVEETGRAALAVGEVCYGCSTAEAGSKDFRRSLYVVRDMREGDELTSENLRAIRPGRGLAPKMLPQMLGRRVKRAIKRGTPLSLDLVC